MKKTTTLILIALALAASTASAASARSYTYTPVPCPSPFVSEGGRVDTCTPVQNALLGFLAKRVAGAHDYTSEQAQELAFLKGRLLTSLCGSPAPHNWYCIASTAVVKTAKVSGKLVRTRIVRKWQVQVVAPDYSTTNPDPTNPPNSSPANWGYGMITLLGSTSKRLA